MDSGPPQPQDPAFGAADLTNCERELIHLPGSIQPHGVLLVLEPVEGTVLQVSENVEMELGVPVHQALGAGVASLGPALGEALAWRLASPMGSMPQPFAVELPTGGQNRTFEALLHRNGDGAVLLELQPTQDLNGLQGGRGLAPQLARICQRLTRAASLGELADAAVEGYRAVAGYDRVMVYRFDPDGHGEVIAEGKEAELEPFLGLHYPASDIPLRARELYLRNRIRVLADVEYQAVPLVPRRFPPSGDELDMSMSWLRSMSPLHTQYLKNMGVTATLVSSLVSGGELWGLIACHHYSPRRVPYPIRAACELIAEVTASRIAVLESFPQVGAEAAVRRFEGRMVDSLSRGDWQASLLEDSQHLLEMVGATGVFLATEDGVRTAGEVPSTGQIRKVVTWLRAQRAQGGVISCASLSRADPSLEDLTPQVAGVLAVELSRGAGGGAGEYLAWVRGEQLQEVRWAGNPDKPVLPGNDPRDLSPRRSFAVWTQEVRGTSRAWSPRDQALARALGVSIRDLILQFRSMSYLILGDRLGRVRGNLQGAEDAVLLAAGDGRVIFENEGFSRLFRRPHGHLVDLEDLPRHFQDPARVREMLECIQTARRGWRGTLRIPGNGGDSEELVVRADVVGRPEGGVLGFVLLLTPLGDRLEVEALRSRLQEVGDGLDELLPDWTDEDEAGAFSELVRALTAHSNVSAREVADRSAAADGLAVLDGLEASNRRTTDLIRRLMAYATEIRRTEEG